MVAHDVDRFSSIEITVAPIPATYDEHGNRIRSIIATDPPDHTPERRLLLPFFAPKAVERFREPTRELCRQLLRGFVERGEVDAAEEYAKQIPPRVIAEILGIDPSRGDDFAEWVRGVLELGLTDPEVREKYRKIIERFFLDEIERRRAEPGDDLISYLINAELDGRPVPMHVVRGNVSLMLIAGIDTTWSSIGSALWHLAQHADDRRRLVEEPALIPIAVEEFLRAYSPVTMARIARHDTMIGDREIKEGERVLLSFPAANRDPGRVRACRRSHHRPRGQPPCRVRRRDPPLRRLQPGAHGDAGRDRGVPGDDPRVRAGRSPRGHVGRRSSPRTPEPAGAVLPPRPARTIASLTVSAPPVELRTLTVIRHTARFEQMTAFYRDVLGMTIVEEWDRSPTDRGAVLAPAGDVANATIEVLTLGDIAVEGVAPTNVVLTLFVDDAQTAVQQIARGRCHDRA